MEQNQPNIVVDYFVYVFPTFTIAPAGVSVTQQVQIQADSDFELLQLMYAADIALAAYVWNTRPIPNISAVITDTGSGRQLMNGAVPLTAIAGIAEQPAWLPQTKVFQRNATVALQLTNFDAAVTYNVRVSMVGRKIFQLQ
jgi:hypothetical protein